MRQVKETEGAGVVLTLTELEAETLAAILGKIGGSSETSPRGYASRIAVKLSTAGFYYDRNYQIYSALQGGLSFDGLPKAELTPRNNPEPDEVVVML